MIVLNNYFKINYLVYPLVWNSATQKTLMKSNEGVSLL
jgi:hypothetical protein